MRRSFIGKGDTKLSLLNKQKNESIQLLLSDKAKEMVSLVDKLLFELDKHSKIDEKISSLLWNLKNFLSSYWPWSFLG